MTVISVLPASNAPCAFDFAARSLPSQVTRHASLLLPLVTCHLSPVTSAQLFSFQFFSVRVRRFDNFFPLMNDLELAKIERPIFLVRGQKVMLDFDLAELYGVETRALKQAVRRNLVRFPTDFMFELSTTEIKNL